jgi:hypothetical protein
LNHLRAVETRGRRPAFLRGNLVLPDVLVRELDRDLELDWNKVVPLNFPRASRDDERLHARQFLVAAKRFARLQQDTRRIRDALCVNRGMDKRRRAHTHTQR